MIVCPSSSGMCYNRRENFKIYFLARASAGVKVNYVRGVTLIVQTCYLSILLVYLILCCVMLFYPMSFLYKF